MSSMPSLPAYGWSVDRARVQGMARPVVNFTKRNRHRAQGCFAKTD